MSIKSILGYSMILFLIVGLFGCRSKRIASDPPTVTETQVIRDSIVKRDTVFHIPAEESSYTATLAVEKNKVVIIDAAARPSKDGTLKNPVVRIENNKLTVDCETRAKELFAEWQEKHRLNTRTVTIQKPPVYIEKPFSWYHRTLMWLGGILGTIGAGYLIYTIKK
ncbi:hypothetical protein [Sphingobacterium siyangense]|uniref:Uncharacterized protein n=1 Tax=Sphingobacterium siyangense TaxID=459529 RepID=A0A562MQH0_9SPHI|nr:hypothetical protein [Sphingobacterium siyangense]TWI22195.1 hypothetical protein IQ31_01600 [Sphingobacterium siyangense]